MVQDRVLVCIPRLQVELQEDQEDHSDHPPRFFRYDRNVFIHKKELNLTLLTTDWRLQFELVCRLHKFMLNFRMFKKHC